MPSVRASRKASDKKIETALSEKLTQRRLQLLAKDGRYHGSPFTQVHLARKLGICKTSLWQWENAEAFPRSLEIWRNWAKSLKCKLEIDLSIGRGMPGD